MSIEQAQHRQRATESARTGFVPCAACGEATEPGDLFGSAAGQICHPCHADREANEVLGRGARDLATTVFFSPGYVAMAVAIFFPMVDILTPFSGEILGVIPLLCMLIGANAIRTGLQLPDAESSDRVRLISAGIFSMLVLGFMAAGMMGVISALLA